MGSRQTNRGVPRRPEVQLVSGQEKALKKQGKTDEIDNYNGYML